jgi:FMN phosphatase YigB (HAD superfamily)
MGLKAITFDFWSTIYQSRTTDYTQRLLYLREKIEQGSQTAIESARLEGAVKTARARWSRTWMEQQRTMTAAEWLDVMLGELKVSLPPAVVAEIQASMEQSVLTQWPSLAPQIEPVLAELADHYRLGVISDTGITPGRVLRHILEKDNLAQYFSHLTFSDEVGRSKPHPTAFLTTLNHLGATPAEAVHVGDLLRTDIAGARAVGMRSVQYIGLSHDSAEVSTGLPITPDAVIEHHTELLPLLRRWNGFSSSHPSHD